MNDYRVYNEWNIAKGDYVRQANDYSVIYKKILKREKIAKVCGTILYSSIMFAFLVLVLKVISKI